MSDRSSTRTASGRRGLLWAALALLLFLIGADLARGDDSLLRRSFSLFDDPPRTRPEQLMDRVIRPPRAR